MTHDSGSDTAGVGTSLDKFLGDSPVPRRTRLGLAALQGEVLSFQVAYRSAHHGSVDLDLAGPLAERVSARRIGLAHVEHPTYGAPPGQLIPRGQGFYPDPLLPDHDYPLYPGQTRAIWLTLPVAANARPGRSRLELRMAFDTGSRRRTTQRLAVDVRIIGARLPRQRLKNTHWFHNDCLMSRYGFAAWSAEHWRMAERYLRNAAAHGVNTILTPVFTPPLDTAVGTERPTVQLVDVEVTGRDRYQFGFTRLERWIDLCRACGMSDFEISHLSTQWGAGFAPKVIARLDGVTKRIFGWDTPSSSPAYQAFLLQFLPKLVACLRKKGALRSSYLHVSDEPGHAQLAQYGAVREILRRGAPELPVLEALSEVGFFEHGLVDQPCPATNHVEPFLAREVPRLWCYYCCGQVTDVSNRFIDVPSARNRILGMQLYKFGFHGFLHWGYNHWYRGLTGALLDPYTCTHGGRLLPPGDGFVVYPGADGPVDSLRWEVFREGLQDLRALRLLEQLAGERRSRGVRDLLDLRPVQSMKRYPRSPAWLLDCRDRINSAIAELT